MAAMAAARALTVNQYLERRNRYDGLCANMEVAPEYDRTTAASRYTEVPLFPSGRPAIAEEATHNEWPELLPHVATALQPAGGACGAPGPSAAPAGGSPSLSDHRASQIFLEASLPCCLRPRTSSVSNSAN